MKVKLFLILVFLSFFILPFERHALTAELTPDQLNIFKEGEGNKMLWDWMHAQAAKLPRRDFPPASIEEWEKRKPELRKEIMRVLGIDGLEKTPLNPKLAGVIDRPEFTVEKILLETRPGFHMTANVWKPKGIDGKLPALLWIPGHNKDGKAAYGWPQNIFVRKGIMVMAIDWVGYGERAPQIHSENAVCWTVGTSTRGFEIWDDIRALDYLISRDDVDPDRIGVAGRSGGGSQTLLMIGVESDRIRAAVPQAGFSSFQKAYIQRAGGHCICNYMLGALRRFNASDVLAMGAPDTLINAVNGQLDPLFPFDGTEEMVREAQKVYDLYGKKNRLMLFSDGGMHDATDAQIRRITKFFMKALVPENKDYSIPEYEHLTPEELAVGLPEDTLTSVDVCRRIAKAIPAPKVPETVEEWNAMADELRRRLRDDILGGWPARGPLNVQKRGEIKLDGVTIEKISIETEPGLRLPLAIIVPETGASKKKVTVRISKKNMYKSFEYFRMDLNEAAEIAKERDYIVVIPDLRGLGEQSPFPKGELKEMRGYLEYELSTSAALIGRPLAGMRAYDITRVVDYLMSIDDADSDTIHLLANQDTCHIAMLAAALDTRIAAAAPESPDPEAGLILFKCPSTFLMPDLPEEYSMDFYVPGILKVTDVPLLAALFAPRKMVISGVYDGGYKMIEKDKLNQAFKTTAEIYNLMGFASNFNTF